jgi:hypothetical protein
MKRIIMVLFWGLISLNSYPQKFEIGANATAGYTLLDIESVVGEKLSDWDQFSYGGNVVGFYHVKKDFSLGIEAGFQRLYYWEYRFEMGYGTQWRWGDESTVHFGPVVELRKNKFFAQAGLNARIFTGGSGTVPAAMLSGGYEIKVSEKLGLPIALKADVVFGSGTPIAVSLSVGFRVKK